MSHDQEFLSKVVEESIILRHGKLQYFEGTPAACELNEQKKRKGLMNLQARLDKKKEHVSTYVGPITTSPLTRDDVDREIHPTRYCICEENRGRESPENGEKSAKEVHIS